MRLMIKTSADHKFNYDCYYKYYYVYYVRLIVIAALSSPQNKYVIIIAVK